MDYNLLRIFCKVAELGSFTKAADVLSQPKSRVSRSVARLESNLGVQLLRRTTRKTSLTLEGESFYAGISALLNSIDLEITKISAEQQEMSGVIRLTASQDIGQTLLPSLICDFCARYPDITFESLITNERLDLNQHNIDLAFRAGSLADSTLKQKKFLNTRFILVCSRGYAQQNGLPKTKQDLLNHRFISFKSMEKKLLHSTFEIKPSIVADSIPMVYSMTIHDSGIAILPDFFCMEALESQKLLRVLPAWQSKPEAIHILYSPSKDIPKKVRILIDFVSERKLN